VSRPHIVAPAERAALRDLELLARTTVEGLRHGLHRSPFHGYSAEFSQYRHYRPGDDLRYVDWKAYARTGRLYSRQFHETANMGALFAIDASRSMDFGSPRTKLTTALAAAAALGTLVIDQGDAAGFLALSGDTARPDYVPVRSGRHHLRLFLAGLARLTPRGETPIDQVLRRAAALLKRRGMVIVLSDFYEEEAALSEIRRLSRMGHDVIVIQVLSPEELTLPGGGAAEFEDLETAARVVAEPSVIRSHYEASVRSFIAGLQRAVEREGLDYVRLSTNEPIEPPLRRLLLQRRQGNARGAADTRGPREVPAAAS
jgi:uncharacterized protein (DUF58 family)